MAETESTAKVEAQEAQVPAPETPQTQAVEQNPNPAPSDSPSNASDGGQGKGTDEPLGLVGDNDEGEVDKEPESVVPKEGYSVDELEVPEGSELDKPTVEAFKEIAKECNLPQESFNTIYNKLMPYLNQRQQEQLGDVRKMFVEQAKADKEIGGANWNETVKLAKSALFKFCDAPTRDILQKSGLDCHVGIIRAFRNVALAIADDTVVKSGTAGGKQDGAKNFFYNSKMN